MKKFLYCLLVVGLAATNIFFHHSAQEKITIQKSLLKYFFSLKDTDNYDLFEWFTLKRYTIITYGDFSLIPTGNYSFTRIKNNHYERDNRDYISHELTKPIKYDFLLFLMTINNKIYLLMPEFTDNQQTLFYKRVYGLLSGHQVIIYDKDKVEIYPGHGEFPKLVREHFPPDDCGVINNDYDIVKLISASVDINEACKNQTFFADEIEKFKKSILRMKQLVKKNIENK